MATTNVKDLKIGFLDQFFFDTNVWLLLFGTVADFESKDQKAYSKLLEELITRDKPIFITSTIISEFANVLLRRDYNQWKLTDNSINQDFKKHFVGTNTYRNSVISITNSINRILKLPNLFRVSDSFHNLKINNILESFKLVDFNDSYINELCIENKYKVVTNDKDFQKLDSKIDIITTQI
jgi:predicted nucleic acid-binding protein